MNEAAIPAKFWERLKEFLEKAKTGSVTFHVKEGKILVLDIEETIRL